MVCIPVKSTALTALSLMCAGALVLFFQLPPRSAVSVNLESGSVTTYESKTLRALLKAGHTRSKLLEYSDVQFCEEAAESVVGSVPEGLKYLMVIGSQKTGTTFLYNVLKGHPAFETAIRRPGKEGLLMQTLKNKGVANLLLKEPKFFNRWPLPPVKSYMHAWDSKAIGDMLAGVAPNKVLLDGSPQYLMVPTAAPRVKAMVPHAKFVIVVRDPPMRTLSDFKMMHRQYPRCQGHNSRLCPGGAFLETIQEELNSRKHHSKCLFETDESDSMTWMDCFKCSFNFVEIWNKRVAEACDKARESVRPLRRNSTATRSYPPDKWAGFAGGGHEGFRCDVPHYGFIDQSKYAAQLAWWLQFFPPEQFLLVSSWQLHDPVESVTVLNNLLEHAGIGGAAPFTTNMVQNVQGLHGKYNHDQISPDDQEALALLREHFRKDQEDLKALADMLYPHLNFTVKLESDP